MVGHPTLRANDPVRSHSRNIASRGPLKTQPALRWLSTGIFAPDCKRGGPCWFAGPRSSVGHRTCPRALVAKRGDVRIREKEGFKCPWFCEHRATREPKAVVCTLGTLNTGCGEAFSLLRFFVAVGQRNEVPPRTVANSDKKYSQHKTRANVSSSNPASTLTTAPLRAPKPRPSANANNSRSG